MLMRWLLALLSLCVVVGAIAEETPAVEPVAVETPVAEEAPAAEEAPVADAATVVSSDPVEVQPVPPAVPTPPTATEASVVPAAAAEDRLITIGNDMIQVVVSPFRASVARIYLPADHPIPVPVFRGGEGRETDTDAPLAILGEFNNRFTEAGGLRDGITDMHSFIAGYNLPASPAVEGDWIVDRSQSSATQVVLTKVWEGIAYSMTYRIDDESPRVHVRLRVHNTNSEIANLRALTIVPMSGIHQDDPAADAYQLNVVGHYDGDNGEFDSWSFPSTGGDKPLRHPETDAETIDPEDLDYLGLKSRFYAVLWNPGAVWYGTGSSELAQWAGFEIQSIEAAGFAEQRTESVVANQAQLQADYGGINLNPDQVVAIDWTLTAAGMQDDYLDLLTVAERKVEYTDGFYRFFRILVVIMEAILGLFVLIVQNYGIAILLLTVFVKALLHRTMVKQQTSMLKMQQLGPEMKRIQEAHKGDRQALAQKQMELFKKHGVNPMGGCLPILIQMPIFIALYQTFSHAAAMRGDSFLWIADLTLPDYTFYTGIPLPFIGDLTINVLPILYIVVSLWAASAYKPPAGASEQQVQMAKMMKWIPVIFGVIFYNMPAGLVLYFTFSALLGSLEMRWIRKRLGITAGEPVPPAPAK